MLALFFSHVQQGDIDYLSLNTPSRLSLQNAEVWLMS